MKDIMPFRGVTLSDLNEIVKEQWKCDLKDYEFEDIEKLAILMI